MPKQLINLIVNTSVMGQPIPLPEAVQLIKNYKDCEGWGDNKTRAVWFSTDEMKQLWQLSQAGQNWDGMRIYFSKYAPDDSIYPNRQTLVFVPTQVKIVNGVTTHVNIFDVVSMVNGTIPVPPARVVPADDPPDDSLYNHGELEP